jgi:predicted nuclease of predicted toxin-antitoxin system
MGSLASELRPIAAELAAAPRVYVDANIPWGAVTFMRHDLHWDALFVLEESALRRAKDLEHFHRALDLGRTLVTLDHDFFDARRFPPIVSPGVVVCTAPDERALKRLLKQLDQMLRSAESVELPLRGQVIELTPVV